MKGPPLLANVSPVVWPQLGEGEMLCVWQDVGGVGCSDPWGAHALVENENKRHRYGRQ